MLLLKKSRDYENRLHLKWDLKGMHRCSLSSNQRSGKFDSQLQRFSNDQTKNACGVNKLV